MSPINFPLKFNLFMLFVGYSKLLQLQDTDKSQCEILQTEADWLMKIGIQKWSVFLTVFLI